ncbi:MAG: XdhC family protein [Saprospiraceae bacterium]
MKELLATINDWTNQKKPFAVATVIKTWGSSPRPVGSALLVSEDMEMAGSVSGGCVEGAVVKAALPLIAEGTGQQLDFGVTDEEAWGVGLSCGGKIQLYTEKFLAFDKRPAEQAVWQRLQTNLNNNEPCVLLTRLQAGEGQHLLIMPDRTALGQQLPAFLIEEGIRVYKERKNQIIENEGVKYFAQVFPRRSQLLIIGAAHITVDLVTLGKMYDFETIVVDPRGIFTNKTQFATEPDSIYEKYPAEVLPDYTLDAYTYAVVLSHDPKIDDNALHILLKSEVGYIGALGSRKTQAKRVARLEAAGFSSEEIAKIHSPVGISIKAKTPKEIAMSIMAEVIMVQNEFK